MLIVAAGAALFGGFGFGCFPHQRMSTTLRGRSDDAPRLIHVVGWRGPVAGDRAFLYALREGGCPHAMETFDWTDGRDGLRALWYAQESTAPAERLARRIETLAREAPDAPIDLTADSSGCGVALDAIGQLPADVRVRTVILSSPALSRAYDLGPALAHVDGRVVAFRSSRDWLILGWGTSLFGTVDGKREAGAGRIGFDPPADASARAKLVQIDYDPAWSDAYGHGGGHAQSLEPRFAQGYLAPLLLAR